MYKTIVDYICDIAMKHKAVKSTKYQKRIMINQQPTNAYMQVIVEDNTFLQWKKTMDVFTMTLNIDILGLPSDDSEILDIQNVALQVGVELLAYIESDPQYKGILSIYDYDLLAVSHFTDDNSAGYRLSLEVTVPNPVDLCNYLDNFDEDNMAIEAEKPLDIIDAKPETKSNELVLSPIKLPKNK